MRSQLALSGSFEIGTEPLVSRCTVLKTLKIGFQLEGRVWRKAINHPCPVTRAVDHAFLAEISQMLGNLGLWKAENSLEMTHAKRTTRQQMDHPQPRRIAETLVNFY